MSATPAGAPSSMIAALREATSSAHTALDSKLGNMTRERYVTFLKASYSVLAELEPKIEAWVGAGDSRVAALRNDLAALHAELPPPSPTPALATLAEAMGAFYVVEGSSLGGIYVAKALSPELPRSYLTLRGDRTGPAWREVTAKIEAWALGASAAARTTASYTARATFDAYSHAFEAMGAFAG